VKPNPPPPDLFSRERYEQHRGEIRLHMSHFFLDYLNDIYRAFEGDLAMTIILGEISHHNTARFFSPEQAANQPMHQLQNDPAQWSAMDGCNAYSVSCATGIPRETVRRKVAELKKRGWIEDEPEQGLRITQACADHFGADFSLRFLNGLLRASRHIESLLADEPKNSTPPPPVPNPPRKTATRKPKPQAKSKPPTQKKKP
jgi:hypothetical protein